MSPRRAKMILLAAAAVGTVYQLGSCLTETLLPVLGVAVLDALLSPVVGDQCTLFNRAGC